mgnify:CR=1 FL=1
MADYAISNVPRRVVYVADGVGPYAFTFEILVQTDIAVYKDDLELTLGSDYTVTINTNGTGSVTLATSPVGATQIALVGARAIERSSDFVTGGDFFANTVNEELDSLTIFAQQNAEGVDRALKAPQTDPTTINMTLPRASVRANRVMTFDEDGNPTVGEQIGDWRGDWTPFTQYYKRDLVKDTVTYNVYICSADHISTGAMPMADNTDADKWDLVVDAEQATEAKNLAEAAQELAENAQAAAEAAQAAAEASMTEAITYAANAASSATNAAASASAASSSATSASNSANAASTSASAASNSASAASNSASTAATQAGNAANSATSASSSATAASASATSASNSAASAGTSATNAGSSAVSAATSATSAASSATSALNAKSAAESARDSTLAAFDSFDDRYLGAKNSDPATDNDGNALIAGSLYFNSADGVMKVFTGSVWVASYVSGADFLARTNNLNDLTNAATARTNLGLGTAAVESASNFATSAQGAKADTALQPSDISVTVQPYNPDLLDAADIGVTVQGYDSNTAKVDELANFTAGLRKSGSDVLAQSDIGTLVQAYDADLTTLGAGGSGARSFLGLVIGTDVQAYDSTILKSANIGSTVQAYDADTAKTDVAQSFTAAQRGSVSALTDGTTITPDFALANNFSVTLGGNRTLANPSNLTAGQSGVIVITQDGTGSRTLAYGSYWKFANGIVLPLTTTASAVDVLAYYVESSTRITARLIGDVK